MKIFLGHTSLPLLVQENHNSHAFSIPIGSANKHISPSKQLHASLHINLCTWSKHCPKMKLSRKLHGAKIYHEVSQFLRSIRGRMGSEHRSDVLSSCRHFTLSKRMSIFPFDTLKLCEAFHKANLCFCFCFFFVCL